MPEDPALAGAEVVAALPCVRSELDQRLQRRQSRVRAAPRPIAHRAVIHRDLVRGSEPGQRIPIAAGKPALDRCDMCRGARVQCGFAAGPTRFQLRVRRVEFVPVEGRDRRLIAALVHFDDQ